MDLFYAIYRKVRKERGSEKEESEIEVWARGEKDKERGK